jgi:4-hydroxy-tetrahydrodipicolinate reductase
MKIGLFGFGKTGKAVASVILQNKEHSLQWIYQTNRLNNRSASEFFGIESTDAGNIYSENNLSIEKLLDEHPVDAIIDSSSTEYIPTEMLLLRRM